MDNNEAWHNRETAMSHYRQEMADLQSELDAARLEIDRAKSSRKHTQRWYAEHYGKLHDWARTRLPEPWVTEFFNCVANGLWSSTEDLGEGYTCRGGFEVVPSNYFMVDDAKGQLILDQTHRAEEAELRLAESRERERWLEQHKSELCISHSNEDDSIAVVSLHSTGQYVEYLASTVMGAINKAMKANPPAQASAEGKPE